ncbi:MAG: tRNA (N(6)-L-threonylcarbamoyladenosine(37)-C(2))-methylthiotransferase MtaB [Clostridiaceae bacterium]|nr:tRNA (N(6)-L-threonylcarbamoyladenosine(37)-C(2))-methylthiotransferase MtaB [Clostridiaceae bacterium]
MKIAFYTLGCKTNQFETQALEKLFAEKGHEIVPFSCCADAYVINTCTVTALGDKKSRNAARRAKAMNPSCILAICGCYSQIKPDEVKELCGADIVCGTGDKSRVVELTERAFSDRQYICSVKEGLKPEGFDFMPAGSLKGRTRALLKVQDGCQNFCSYCIIPYARGLSRSLPLDKAMSEAKRLGEEGYKEIIITGIEISSYGFDLPSSPSLEDMITSVCQSAPDARIRLGSLEPRTVTEAFCLKLANLKNLCPHFHLSLQSGCDKTLKAMNRKYSSARFYESCRLLRQYFPGCAITADLIVGFPGETDGDFEESLSFVERCAFSQVHIFSYSPRPGTKAAAMPDQLTHSQKQARAEKAGRLCQALKSQYLESLVGMRLPVLFEQSESSVYSGHCPQYCLVEVEGQKLSGKVKNVYIQGADGDHLFGKVETD